MSQAAERVALWCSPAADELHWPAVARVSATSLNTVTTAQALSAGVSRLEPKEPTVFEGLRYAKVSSSMPGRRSSSSVDATPSTYSVTRFLRYRRARMSAGMWCECTVAATHEDILPLSITYTGLYRLACVSRGIISGKCTGL